MKVTPVKAIEIKYLRKNQKYSLRKIGREVGVSEATVRAVLKDVDRALAARTRKRAEAPIKARRKVIVAIAKEKLFEKIKGRKVVVGKKFSSLGDIAREYAVRRRGLSVSPMTVSRDLKAEGFGSRVRPRVVNNDPVKNKARFEFAKDVKRKKISAKNVIYSDECWVNDNDNTNRREWTPAGETPTVRRYQKRPGIKLMVWGAIGVGYKSPLIFLEESVTAEVYQRSVFPTIKRAMRTSRKAYFMQDGARPHTAKTTIEAFEEMRVTVLDWPAHSPHLNPIEMLWNAIHQRIALLRPKSDEELKKCARKVWAEFDQKTIDKMVMTFDESIARSISNKGAPW